MEVLAILVSFMALIVSGYYSYHTRKNTLRQIRLEEQKHRDEVMPRFENFSAGFVHGHLKLWWENNGQKGRVTEIRVDPGELFALRTVPTFQFQANSSMDLRFEPLTDRDFYTTPVHIEIDFEDRLGNAYRITVNGTGMDCQSTLNVFPAVPKMSNQNLKNGLLRLH